ncbi:MAG: hypothetical protein Q8T11_03160, partial [Elusimicrobiota bacterium]|nr:hypothetical protein [Elusimicrobiota bacterium]
MSWIRRRPLLALGALALVLRASCALVTEFKPIFPAYYYTDANLIHAAATGALEDVHAGRAPMINGTLSARIQTLITLQTYRTFGARPLAIKLINAVLGALAVVTLTWALTFVFPLRIALISGIFVALWPSHIFYTSQNLKEAPAALLAYAALGGTLAAGFDINLTLPRATSFAFGAALALIGAGFYRSYVLVNLTAALLLALGLASLSARARRANTVATAAILLAALMFYPIAASSVLLSFHSQALGASDRGRIQPRLIPVTYNEFHPGAVIRPTSPEGITFFRKSRQFADRYWAKFQSPNSREIGTQIYPDAEFKSWGDVLSFLPKGSFAALFMPLPGLYALDGKIGRW